MAPKAKQCVGITALLFGTAALNMHAAAATRVNVVIKRRVIKGSGKNKGRGKGRGKKSRFKQEQGQGQGQGTTPLQGSPSSPNTSSLCGSDTEESHSNTSISTAGSYPSRLLGNDELEYSYKMAPVCHCCTGCLQEDHYVFAGRAVDRVIGFGFVRVRFYGGRGGTIGFKVWQADTDFMIGWYLAEIDMMIQRDSQPGEVWVASESNKLHRVVLAGTGSPKVTIHEVPSYANRFADPAYDWYASDSD